jgi:hypothetical protein
MSEWIDYERWADCVRMERPGVVFEVVNAEGQRLLTPCVQRLETPWDWTSGPVRFRAAAAPQPRHSNPMPQAEKPRAS